MSNRNAAAQNIIRPQEGYQMMSLASPADIVIGGGAAGVGKTFSLLLEPLRHINNPKFGAVCFRRTSPQIRAQGGLWDTSMGLYPFAGAKPRESILEWKWPSGARISFKHLQHEKDKLEWQGSQIPLILWDELTHFTETMFFYMLTRNRFGHGVKPYVRATCNPDPESWVAKFIEWWIDQETGFPIREREGVIRWFTKAGDDYIWGDTFQEVVDKAWYFLEGMVAEYKVPVEVFVKSITFISGKLSDNQALLTADPSYLANLLAQDEQTVQQLLKGNWKFIPSDLDIYDYPAFNGMFDNLYEVEKAGKYITADIAGLGSNKFVVGNWEGFKLNDIVILDKNNGPEAVQTIENMAKVHKVQNRHILYDADGIGALMDGFIKGAVSFHGGAKPIDTKNDAGKVEKEDYFNLKSQIFYRSGRRVKAGEMSVSEEVAYKMYDNRMTVKQRFMHERKAIKRHKPDADGKLRVIPKEEMKVKLNGESPDLMDMFAMREYFELKPAKTWVVA